MKHDIKFDPFFIRLDNEMEGFMEDRRKQERGTNTPLCNCTEAGGVHRMGSPGCTEEVSEQQLDQDDAAIAALIRLRTGVKASDKAILHHIGETVAEYNNRDRIKRRLYFAGGMLCLIAIVVLLVWGRG